MDAALFSPDHLHVAVNHLPLVGLAASIVPLLYGLIRRETHTLRVGFFMCLLFGGSVAVVMATGDEADEDIDHGSRLGTLLDDSGRQWLHEHEERAESAAIVSYVAAACGFLGLLALWKFPKLVLPMGALSLILCLMGTAAMVWVAQSGGRIRHAEFRTNQAR